ncbi:MAG: alpha/beta hydrolase [Planctomycetaceae bacterium]|nr:alpha/beta hydrolase [Planctomycetales bacterium]MCB9921159.1 alpha/beta hydrolase [Planctomycetaceae bacterium]
MQREAIVLLLLATTAVGVWAEESELYRGQSSVQWLQQLSHPSASARAAAAQAFVVIGKGNEDASAPLIQLLSDSDERVRFYAAYALGKLEIHHKQCIEALINVLPDKDEHVRYTAQWSLSEIAKQITRAADANASIDEGLAELLAETETQLLAAGALPGHINDIREAIVRFQPPAPEPATPQPPVEVSSTESDEITSCLKALAAEDVITQARAIERLRQLGVPCVERLLESPEVIDNLGSVGWHLPQAIAGLGNPVVPALIKALQSSHDETSDFAASALRDLGPQSSVGLPELMQLLGSDETSDLQKQRVIDILGEMGPSAVPAVDLLVAALNDVEGDGDLSWRAIQALGSIGPGAKHAVPDLLNQFVTSAEAPYTQAEIAASLVRIDPKSDSIVKALSDAVQASENIFDGLGIAEKLCKCEAGGAAIVPWLLGAIDQTEFEQRATVLRLLGEYGGASTSEVSPRVFACLMGPAEDVVVRVAAAKALGKLGPEALKQVVNELQYGDEPNQLIAVRSLVEIGSAASPAKAALLELLREERAGQELRSLAAVALGQLGTEARDAVPTLTEILRDKDSDSYLRSMCVVALGQVDPSATAILESMLDDSEAELQIAAAYALCKDDAEHPLGLATLVRWLDNAEYRASAINSLVDIGETSLTLVVEKMKDASADRDTRLACLEVVSAFDECAVDPLCQTLNDQELAEDAGWALRDRGNKVLPTLVKSFDDEVRFTPPAREIIGQVIQDMFDGLGAGGDEETWSGGHALVQRDDFRTAIMSAAGGALARPPEAMHYEAILLPPESVENAKAEPVAEAMEFAPESESEYAEAPPVPKGYKTVDVFYGTNRQPIEEASASTAGRSRWVLVVGFGIVALVVVSLVGMYRRGACRQATAGLAGTTLVLLLGLLLFIPATIRPSIEKIGPKYGGEYSDRVEMGVCQVTIPDTHREGELETLKLLRLEVTEDLQKHIVLRSVRRMESDEFFGGLRREMQSRGNNILVFVHGFNVSFEDAARRTAQMSEDLNFAGAPVFYSWPSQADWWKYRADEKNVELSVDQLKSFLLAIAERSDADTINLVAHSMGNRVLTAALKEIDVAASEREQMFNQVILAAPDIDADIFKQRIAPAIVTKAKHVTLYASSNDLALIASKTFNSGDPRAGDAGSDLVVYPGIETIDVTAGDSSLLGHSYYGSSVSVLRDIELLLHDQPASSRKFLAPVSLQDDRTYWLFQPPRISRRSDDHDAVR